MNVWIMLGWMGQSCFFLRFLVQWVASERAQKSVVPGIFWHLSLAGSAFLVSYALYRNDPVFVLGTLPGMFIYARNLFVKKTAKTRQILPIGMALMVFVIWASLNRPTVDHRLWAMVGFFGSLIWMSRFVVQWWISERAGKVIMPPAFWIMSIVGSLLLLTYSIFRKDPVFIAGQSIGYIVYTRNLLLIYRASKSNQKI